jgi:hypothetical protein
MRTAGRLALVTMSSLLAACGSSSGSSPPAGPAPDANLNGDRQAGDAGVPADATISDGPLVDDARMEAGPGPAEDAGDAAIRGDAGEGEDGATTDSGLAVPPDASLGAVTAIAAGSAHTCALKNDGTVSCWGNNRAGEIGTNAAATLGTNTPQTYAVQVAGLSSVTAISAGLETTCGILSSGALSCLGSSFGPPAMGDLYTPAPIAGLTGVTQVSSIRAPTRTAVCNPVSSRWPFPGWAPASSRCPPETISRAWSSREARPSAGETTTTTRSATA